MAKNLVQMSVDGILYDIRDQRMAMRLDTLNSSLMLALDHKQNADTAVVTNMGDDNWIGNLTSKETNHVARSEKIGEYRNSKDENLYSASKGDDYHSLWFSEGNVDYTLDPEMDKELKENIRLKEERRAWSSRFAVKFGLSDKDKDLDKPTIIGVEDGNEAEVDLYGNAKHADLLNSALNIRTIAYQEEKSLKGIEYSHQAEPLKNLIKWSYYGDKNKGYMYNLPNVDDDNPNNTIGEHSKMNNVDKPTNITNIALPNFFQKEVEGDIEGYYRVLSQKWIANRDEHGVGVEPKNARESESGPSVNAYKIVTLDECGLIPDNFLGEIKLDKQMTIGTTVINVTNNNKFIYEDPGDEFAIQIQPSKVAENDEDEIKFTELTQTSVDTKHIKALTVDVKKETTTKELTVSGDAKFDTKITVGSVVISNLGADGNDYVKSPAVLSTKCLTIPVFGSETEAIEAISKSGANSINAAAIWVAAY